MIYTYTERLMAEAILEDVAARHGQPVTEAVDLAAWASREREGSITDTHLLHWKRTRGLRAANEVHTAPGQERFVCFARAVLATIPR